MDKLYRLTENIYVTVCEAPAPAMWAPRTGHEHCAKCGRTDRRHAGRGLCKACYKIANRAAMAARRRGGRWAARLGLDACQNCGGYEAPHMGRGLCAPCYRRDFRRRHADKVRAYDKLYNMRHAEERARAVREWERANWDKVLERKRKYYERVWAVYGIGASVSVRVGRTWKPGRIVGAGLNFRIVRLADGSEEKAGWARMLPAAEGGK